MSRTDDPDRGDVLATMSREANGLIEMLRLTSLEGVEAVRSNDVAMLQRLVRDRTAIVGRADELLEKIRVHLATRPRSDARSRDEVDRLAATLRGAEGANARLVEASIDSRDSLISAIERSTERAARPGYASDSPRVGKTIDLRR